MVPTRSSSVPVLLTGRGVMRHLLSTQDLSRAQATAILDEAERFEQALTGREVKAAHSAWAHRDDGVHENSTVPGSRSRWLASG